LISDSALSQNVRQGEKYVALKIEIRSSWHDKTNHAGNFADPKLKLGIDKGGCFNDSYCKSLLTKHVTHNINIMHNISKGHNRIKELDHHEINYFHK
jgi:hypothetical protein